MRFVVVHYHMFKNAGTSVDRVLQRNLGKGWISLESQDPSRFVSAGEILQAVLADSNVRAVSSHTSRLPAPEHADVRFMPVFMLRHPVDRIRSAYDFMRRTPDPIDPRRVLQAMMKTMPFKEFIEKTLAMNNAFVVNFQTTYLSRAHLRVPVHGLAKANAGDLGDLKNYISSADYVGIVERFSDSMAVMERVVSKYWPDFRSFTIADNITSGRADSLEKRMTGVAEELGAQLFERLLEANEMDLDLYSAGERRLDELLSWSRSGRDQSDRPIGMAFRRM